MSEELNIVEHNTIKDPNLGNIFFDVDLLKEELSNYEQDIEIHECTDLANGKNNQDNIEVRPANFPRIIRVEHNSVSFDIEILEEVEEIIGDDEKPDHIDLENELNVFRTTEDKFETFFKQQVDYKNFLNGNVIAANLDQYLLSSSRFCGYCFTLFSTKNAFDVHTYLQHSSFTFLIKNKPQKPRRKYNKREPNTINKKRVTCFNNYSKLLNPPLQSHLIQTQENANSHINLNNVLKSTHAAMRNKLCSTNFGPNVEKKIKRMPAFKKCVVVINKLQIPVKSVKLAHERLNTNSNTLAKKMTRICPKKTKHMEDDDNDYRYKCHICSFYFTKSKSLSRHLENSHGITEKYPDVCEVSLFYPKCKFCVRCLKNPFSYNSHLWRSHRENVKNKFFSDLTQPPKVHSDLTQPPKVLSDLTQPPKVLSVLTQPPKVLSDLAQPPKVLSALTQPPKVLSDLTQPPKVLSALTQPPKVLSDLTQPPKVLSALTQPPKVLSDLTQPPKVHFDLTQPPKVISALTQPPKILSDRKATIEISNDFEAKTSFGTKDNNTFIPEKVVPSSQAVVSFPLNFEENCMDIVQVETKDATKIVDHHNSAKIHHDKTHWEPNIIRSVKQTAACKINDANQGNTKTYMLQSAYFKCLKCNIYFLSSDVATNHKDHTEMLIHWKCSICNLVFKKEDEMHELQHALTENLTVYGVLPGDKIRILYNCPKCAVHFDNFNFFKHYPTCEKNTPQAKYCTDCDILIDDLACKEHRQIHKGNKYAAGDFIIVESDVIPVTENETMFKNPGPNISSKILKLYYCKFCESYFHNMASSQVHIQGRCKNLCVSGCRYCGLLLINTTLYPHNELHKKWPFLCLNHFEFFDLEKKSITPPIPTYVECKACHIHFFINWYLLHKCGNEMHRICGLCQISYEKKTFELHMQFHNYTKTDISMELSRYCNRTNISAGQELLGSDMNALQLNADEPKQPPIESSSDAKLFRTKDSTDFNIYYCSNCESFRHYCTEQTINYHRLKLCSDILTYSCCSCGLKFSDSKCYKTHKILHEKIKELDINYFDFYDYEGNPIDPPLPKYFECRNCHIHFFQKYNLRYHDCENTDYEMCGFCEIKYDTQTIKFHMSFHSYSNKDLGSDILLVSKKH